MTRFLQSVVLCALFGSIVVAPATAGATVPSPTAAPFGAPAATPDTPGSFIPLTPQRLLDTRNGTGTTKATIPAGGAITLHLPGKGTTGNKIPNTISAIAINITATNTTGTGYLTAYPDLTTKPGTSTLGFTKGTTVANFAVVPVGTNGNITIYNGGPGTTDIIGDVAGYYLAGTPTAAGTFAPLTPQRLLDTRNGTGTTKATIPAGTTITLHLPGKGTTGNKIPDTISAIAINITATNTTGTGYLTAYPDLTTKPGTSTLGFTKGTTVANFAVVPVGTNGNITIYNGGPGTTDIIGDVAGYYLAGTPTAAGTFAPLTPQRLLDTRNGTGTTKATIPAGTTITLHLPGKGTTGNKIPDTISAIAINITATNTTGTGYLTAYPDLTTKPGTSTLGFTKGTTVANFAVVPVGTNGNITIYNGGPGTTDIIGDVAGYYLASSPVPPDTTPPGPVTGVTAGSIFSSGLTLQWINPAGDVTGVLVRRAVGAVAPSSPTQGTLVADITGTAGSAGSAADTDLAPATTYSYALFAHDAARNYSTAAAVTATTTKASAALTWSTPIAIDALHGSPTSLSCPVTGFCAAVDSMGNASTYSSGWSGPLAVDAASAQAGGLTSVSCVPVTFCLAVDAAGHFLTFDGSTWSAPAGTGTTARLSSVSCLSTTFCVAVGSGGVATTYNGSTWKASTIDAGQDLAAVSCPTAGFCAAVETAGRVLILNGTTWSAPRALDSNGSVTSVDCVSASFCVAVDAVQNEDFSTTGHAVTFTSTTSAAPATIDPDSGLLSVSCTAASACRAADETGSVLTLSGTTWTATTTGGGPLAAISCPAAASCTAVDVFGSALAFTASGWGAPVPFDAANSLTSVSCASGTFCAAVDVAGQSVLYNGTAWAAPTVADSAGGLNGVSCVSASFCTAVGLVDAVTYGGTGWTASGTIAPGSLLTSVSCRSTSFCVTTGNDGTAVVLTNGTWSPKTVDAGQSLNAVSCASTTPFCVAVDDGGRAFTYNGNAWSGPVVADTSADSSLVSVSCPSSTFCVAVDAGGDAVRYNGTGWSAPVSITDSGATSVSCSSTTRCVAVDFGGNAIAFDGAGWSAPVAIDPGSAFLGGLTQVSCPSDTFCMAIDQAGRAVSGRG